MGSKSSKKASHPTSNKIIYRPCIAPEGEEFSHWKLVPSSISGYDKEFIPVHRKRSDSATKREEYLRPRSRTFQDDQEDGSIEIVSKYFDMSQASTDQEEIEENIEYEEKVSAERYGRSRSTGNMPVIYDRHKLSTQGYSYAC